VGDRVRYLSAERAEWEELPANLVDWSATEAWAKDHSLSVRAPSLVSPEAAQAAQIDQEEQRERARTPAVLPGLRLPDEQGVWVLDTFKDQPELVRLTQNTGNVNQQTGHNILRSALNPLGGTKQMIEIPGANSKIQLHVNNPALYVSLSTDDSVDDSEALTVNIPGAGRAKEKDSHSSPASQYVIVRVQSNFKHNYRVVSGTRIGVRGNVSQTEDIVPTVAQVLPGNHWMKLTPREPLTIGEYALMEILAPGEVNTSVWDFRIDPQGPDSKNAIMPLGTSR
jgi:hypothetical protein